MKKRKLGIFDVSEIGMGCMGLSHAAGKPVSIDEGVRIVRAAYELGYTYFDTAKNYGYVSDPCQNEKIVGDALHGIRDRVIIATKTGVEFDYAVDPYRPPLLYDSSRSSIFKSVEESLKRLKTDYIDLYFQARPDPKVEPEEVAETMGMLIKEGKIRAWGLSEIDTEYLKRAHAVCPVSVVENRYNITDREHESLIPFLEENRIGWIAHGPLSKGLLSATFHKGVQFERDDWRGRIINDENLERYKILLDYLKELGKEKNATPAQLAIAWILHRKPYIVPIPGTTKIARLEENARASTIVLTEDEMKQIDFVMKEHGISCDFQ